jgi:hypothetical protein
VLRQNHSGHARPVATTQQRTKIPRVGHTIKRNEKRLDSVLRLQQFVEVGLGQSIGEGDDTLWRLATCSLFQSLASHVEDLNSRVVRKLTYVVDDVARIDVGGDPDLARTSTTRNQQLANRLAALDLFASE